MEKQPDEVRGNLTADQSITFEYCGGWGYMRYVNNAIEKIEEKTPGVFKYNISSDAGVTGRLEATLTSKDGSTTVNHSKQASKKYIHENYELFLTTLAEASAQWVWQILNKWSFNFLRILGHHPERMWRIGYLNRKAVPLQILSSFYDLCTLFSSYMLNAYF